MKKIIIILTALALVSCSESAKTAIEEKGHLDQDCFDNNTCMGFLVCENGLCVLPPDAENQTDTAQNEVETLSDSDQPLIAESDNVTPDKVNQLDTEPVDNNIVDNEQPETDPVPDSEPIDNEPADIDNFVLVTDKVFIATEETLIDPHTTLEWERNNGFKKLNLYDLQSAIDYCSDLEAGGYKNWRLPTISELRTVIVSNKYTQTGGICAITDENSQTMDSYEGVCPNTEKGTIDNELNVKIDDGGLLPNQNKIMFLISSSKSKIENENAGVFVNGGAIGSVGVNNSITNAICVRNYK